MPSFKVTFLVEKQIDIVVEADHSGPAVDRAWGLVEDEDVFDKVRALDVVEVTDDDGR